MKLEMQDKLNTRDPLSKFFPNVPADKTAVYNQVRAQTKTIMAAALARDTEPLLASLANRATRTPGVLRGWQDVVENIRPTQLTFLGIRPSLYLENACEAVTKLTGDGESGYFISIWRDGQNVGVPLTELTNNSIFHTIDQPVTANTLAAYHLSHAQPRQFYVEYEGNTVQGLISEQNVMARIAGG